MSFRFFSDGFDRERRLLHFGPEVPKQDEQLLTQPEDLENKDDAKKEAKEESESPETKAKDKMEERMRKASEDLARMKDERSANEKKVDELKRQPQKTADEQLAQQFKNGEKLEKMNDEKFAHNKLADSLLGGKTDVRPIQPVATQEAQPEVQTQVADQRSTPVPERSQPQRDQIAKETGSRLDQGLQRKQIA